MAPKKGKADKQAANEGELSLSTLFTDCLYGLTLFKAASDGTAMILDYLREFLYWQITSSPIPEL
jgi:hypothetical protein